MTDAPDEIIAGKTLIEWEEFSRRDDCLDQMVPSDLRGLVSYISARTDLSDARMQEGIAAAYEAVARECEILAEATKYDVDASMREGKIRAANILHKRFRALTPADAQSALDRMVQESVRERDALLREAVDLFTACLDGAERCGDPDAECPMQDAFSDDDMLGLRDRIAAAIRNRESTHDTD